MDSNAPVAQLEQALDHVDVRVLWSPPTPPIIYCNNGCFRQSWYNQEHRYRDMDLRTVVGSVGVGVQDPFFEYGNANFRTVRDFRTSAYTTVDGEGRVRWDIHMWLEDSAGSVYDIVNQSMVHCALFRGKELHLKPYNIIEGGDKAVLARKGLHYIAAPSPAQELLLAAIERDWRGNYETRLRDEIGDIMRAATVAYGSSC